MGAVDFIDQVDSSEDGVQNGPKKPFWALDFENEDELLKWLNTELDHLKNQAIDRHMNQKKNLASYRGIQLTNQDRTSRDEAASESSLARRAKNPRVVYNHMVDMVEQDVARMTKYRGAVACNPPSEDNEDRVVAEVTEKLIEGFWDKVGIDKIMTMHSRRKRIFSEDFFWVTWNKNLGGYDINWIAEVFKKAGIKGDPRKMRKGEIREIFRKKIKEIPRIPLVDPETGSPVTDGNGQPLFIDRPVRQGDVHYKLWFSWNMFLQRREEYEEVEYGFGRERLKIDTVKAQHPKKRDKIGADTVNAIYDADTCEDVTRSDEVEVVHFFHKSTDELDQGRYIKFTRTAILRNGTNPYTGDDDKAIFPWVRTPDIDTPAVLNGDSTVTHGRGPQTVYNNLVSLKVRNRFLFAHPKWMAPAKSCKVESLANGTSVLWYKGPIAPAISQPAINESNESMMMQEAKGDMQQIMGVYGISRGEPPAGVTAAVAMTYLDEQENDRAAPGVATHSETLKEVAKRTAWLMADNYEDDEGRLEAILGKNESAQIKEFKMANLRDSGDLEIQNTTALPQQKSARLQVIMDVKKEFPGIIPDDMAVDLLGLGEVDKLRNSITVAIRKAESENGRMMNGAEVPAPLEFEMQISHYRIHMRQMNELAFQQLPEPSQEHFKDHVMAHEMIMVDIAKRNPQFLMGVTQEFPGFPFFYVPEEMAAPTPAEEVPGLLASQGMPMQAGGAPEMGPPPAEPTQLPPGIESQVPPPEGQAPGAEMIAPIPGA